MRILVKIGGAELDEPASRSAFARSVARARAAGHELVVVHGGGNQIRAWTKRLGLVDRYHEGLRVTDATTAEVVLAVLGGSVNRELVAALQAAGVPAVGLTGADGALFSARRLLASAPGIDLGYVGELDQVDPRLALALLSQGYAPVIATVAPLAPGAPCAPVAPGAPGAPDETGALRAPGGPRDRFYNVNADLAVGPLAGALRAEAVLFLTDVPGVLDGAGQRLARLSPAQVAELARAGVLRGGMVPKVDAALAALARAPSTTRAIIKIAPGAGEDAILDALRPEVGTTFSAERAEALC